MLNSTRKRCLLVTFDAFGTIYRPTVPIAEHYLTYASTKHNLDISSTTIPEFSTHFKNAFKQTASLYPNYGKEAGLSTTDWWVKLINTSFTTALNIREDQLPRNMAEGLVRTYTGEDPLGRNFTYDNYICDILLFLQTLAERDDAALTVPVFQRWKRRNRHLAWRNEHRKPESGIWGTSALKWDHVVVGVISNSDDRVETILRANRILVSERGRIARGNVDGNIEGNGAAKEGGEVMKAEMKQEMNSRAKPRANDSERTSTPDSTVQQRKTKFNVRRSQWKRHVDFITLSYAHDQPKPSPWIFAEAFATAVSISPTADVAAGEWTCVHVGDDAKEDALGASKMGWTSMLLEKDLRRVTIEPHRQLGGCKLLKEGAGVDGKGPIYGVANSKYLHRALEAVYGPAGSKYLHRATGDVYVTTAKSNRPGAGERAADK